MRKGIVALLLLLGALLVAVPATAESVEGIIRSVSGPRIDVSGRRYVIEKSTVCEDKAGERVDPAELRPGTAVELELDGSRVAVLRADLLR